MKNKNTSLNPNPRGGWGCVLPSISIQMLILSIKLIVSIIYVGNYPEVDIYT